MLKNNKFSQRMNKNKEIILQNPFHPLDLSPHDLLAIYKRFEQSRIINRNPKQELPIQIISQLIASLKGCPPSYIQKCISQALIKDTISWNQFLTFLDQESEVRQKILQWLMYQKTVVKYKLDREWPIRSKISTFFEEITFFKYIELGQNDKLILCSVDNLQLYLLSELNGRMTIIDSYKNKSERITDDRQKNIEEDLSVGKDPSKLLLKNDSKLRKIGNRTNKSESKEMDKIEKTVNQIMSSAPKMNNLLSTSLREDEDDEAFFRKERKNINSLFGIWKDLNLDHSISYAKAVAPKISEKSINQTHIAQLKQIYSELGEEKTQEKKMGSGTSGVKPLDRAFMALRDLQRQKRILSYNPYASVKSGLVGDVQVKLRKNTKQRKQRQYAHESSKQAYNQKLRCLAIMYYNMQVALIKIVKQFSKTSLEEQDKIKIMTENEHKKNQIIEAVDFYYHSILNQWFLIVLIRVQYKNELRNQNQSYIRGYQINLIPNKRRSDQDYRFASKKEAFTFPISQPAKKKEEGTKHQVFKMEMQIQYGIHFITVGGRYISIREDYREKPKANNMHNFTNSSNKHNEDIYFTFQHQQKFKNAGLSLSCLTVGKQINKIVFGTIRGMIIIYDMFSHYFKIKKVSNSQITEIKVLGSLLYILTIDQKLIILDLVKIQQIQHVSIKNEAKLHEKIKRFQLYNNIIYFYGTQVKSYCQFVNEELQHQQRKMQTMYRWRLDKLFKQESAYRQADNFKDKTIKKYLPKGAKDLESTHANLEIVLASESYFLILTDILELIVVEKKSLKIKFTMILAIPYDSKVMKMALSPNQKLIALLLFNQQIIIFNIHTQDQYQCIKPAPYIKYTTLTFLDLKNQYLLANGTENGNIMLSPYSTIPQKEPKMLQLHKRAITFLTVSKKDFLISCSEDYLISIWLLPFNILKHEISVTSSLGYIVEQMGIFKQFLYLRALQGSIIQINTNQGKLSKTIEGIQDWTTAKVDSCTGQIFGTTKQCMLEKLARTTQGWSKTVKPRIDTSKNEIKQIGIVESQRVVIFVENGLVCTWLYQNQQFGKPFHLSQQ